jgi:hypothetical protein
MGAAGVGGLTTVNVNRGDPVIPHERAQRASVGIYWIVLMTGHDAMEADPDTRFARAG